MTFSEWLDRWGHRHPVKAPAPDPSAFTSQVMRRLADAPAAEPWRLPRLAWVTALAAAAVIVVLRLPTSPGRLAAAIARDADVLAALGEPVEDDLSDEALAAFLLAEAPADNDETWLAETMQLLEQLDESLPEGDSADDEEWLRELDMLEQSGPSAAS